MRRFPHCGRSIEDRDSPINIKLNNLQTRGELKNEDPLQGNFGGWEYDKNNGYSLGQVLGQNWGNDVPCRVRKQKTIRGRVTKARKRDWYLRLYLRLDKVR